MRTLATESLALLRAKLLDARDALRDVTRVAWRVAVHTWRYADWRAAEGWTALMALLWGAWLVLSPWSVTDEAAAYEGMRQSAAWFGLTGDGLWGFLLLIGGVLQFVGFYTEDHRVQRLAALHLVGVWSFIGACFVVSAPHLTSTVSVPMYVLPSAWVYYRVTRAATNRTRQHRRRAADARDYVADRDARDAADAVDVGEGA